MNRFRDLRVLWGALLVVGGRGADQAAEVEQEDPATLGPGGLDDPAQPILVVHRVEALVGLPLLFGQFLGLVKNIGRYRDFANVMQQCGTMQILNFIIGES